MPWTVGLADSLRVGGEIAIKRQLGSGTERGNAGAKRDGQARAGAGVDVPARCRAMRRPIRQ